MENVIINHKNHYYESKEKVDDVHVDVDADGRMQKAPGER
jgi:hypothetical protein